MFNSRSLFGIALILVGFAFLAVNFGWIDTNVLGTIFSYWPLLVIGWGGVILMRREDQGDTINGSILIIIGFLFLGNRLNLFTFSWSQFWRIFWPIALILFGWSMLSNRSGRSGKGNYAIMGALERGGEPWEVDNSSFVALFGGVELDLHQAEFMQKDLTLDLTATFGGIDIKVPEDVTVNINGTVIFGGIDFFGRGQGGVFATFKKQHKISESDRTLNIHCRCAFGGIEIKH